MSLPSMPSLLSTAKHAQDQYGLRNEDYSRYRKYCTSKVQKLRKKLGHHHGKGKSFKWNPYLNEAEILEKTAYLQLVLFEAERAWAYGLEYKQAIDQKASHKHDSVRKFKRAAQYAEMLAELCQRELGESDTYAVLESRAYSCIMKATAFFESQKQWKQALAEFWRAKAILERLAATGSAEQEALCMARLDEIEPSIRYCLYNIQFAVETLGVPKEDLEPNTFVDDSLKKLLHVIIIFFDCIIIIIVYRACKRIALAAHHPSSNGMESAI